MLSLYLFNLKKTKKSNQKVCDINLHPFTLDLNVECNPRRLTLCYIHTARATFVSPWQPQSAETKVHDHGSRKRHMQSSCRWYQKKKKTSTRVKVKARVFSHPCGRKNYRKGTLIRVDESFQNFFHNYERYDSIGKEIFSKRKVKNNGDKVFAKVCTPSSNQGSGDVQNLPVTFKLMWNGGTHLPLFKLLFVHPK